MVQAMDWNLHILLFFLWKGEFAHLQRQMCKSAFCTVPGRAKSHLCLHFPLHLAKSYSQSAARIAGAIVRRTLWVRRWGAVPSWPFFLCFSPSFQYFKDADKLCYKGHDLEFLEYVGYMLFFRTFKTSVSAQKICPFLKGYSVVYLIKPI